MGIESGMRGRPNFYPRSPRGERHIQVISFLGYNYFYPRSPRGERQRQVLSPDCIGGHFYPRSPRGERRFNRRRILAHFMNFYPRSPRGERLIIPRQCGILVLISIHAPREGSDYFG